MHRTSDIPFSLEVPPEVHLSGPHRPVAEGDNVTLTCNVTEGVPKPEPIRWLRAKISLDEKSTTMILRSIKMTKKGLTPVKQVIKEALQMTASQSSLIVRP